MAENENRADYFLYFLFKNTIQFNASSIWIVFIFREKEKKVQGIRGKSLLPLENGRLITREYHKTLMAVW